MPPTPTSKLLGGSPEGGGPGHDPGYEEASDPSRETRKMGLLGPRAKNPRGGVEDLSAHGSQDGGGRGRSPRG